MRTAASCSYHHPLSVAGLPPETLNQNETFLTQTVFVSIFYCSNMKINKCKKMVQGVGGFADIKLTLWFVSLLNWFVGEMWMSSELWARNARCYKQSLVGHFGRHLENQKAFLIRPFPFDCKHQESREMHYNALHQHFQIWGPGFLSSWY